MIIKGQELDLSEERRMLELDEAIEAVDAAIEYKNEVICSRHYELKSTVCRIGKVFQVIMVFTGYIFLFRRKMGF